MGGDRETFLTTQWSLIEGVKEHIDKDRALIGLLLERYVLVVPSLSPDDLALGWIYALVTVAFAATFITSYRLSARRARSIGRPWPPET